MLQNHFRKFPSLNLSCILITFTQLWSSLPTDIDPVQALRFLRKTQYIDTVIYLS